MFNKKRESITMIYIYDTILVGGETEKVNFFLAPCQEKLNVEL